MQHRKAFVKGQTERSQCSLYFFLSVNRSACLVHDVLIKILAESQVTFYREVTLKELFSVDLFITVLLLRDVNKTEEGEKTLSQTVCRSFLTLLDVFFSSAVCIVGRQSCNSAAEFT